MRALLVFIVALALLVPASSAVVVTGSTFRRDVDADDFSPPAVAAPAGGMAALTFECVAGQSCTITCLGWRSCAGATFVCPTDPGTTCAVQCDGVEACFGATILNPTSVECKQSWTLLRVTTAPPYPYDLDKNYVIKQINSDAQARVLAGAGSTASSPVVRVTTGVFTTNALDTLKKQQLDEVTFAGVGYAGALELLVQRPCS